MAIRVEDEARVSAVYLTRCQELNKWGGRRQKNRKSKTQPSINRAAKVLRGIDAQILNDAVPWVHHGIAATLKVAYGCPETRTADANGNLIGYEN